MFFKSLSSCCVVFALFMLIANTNAARPEDKPVIAAANKQAKIANANLGNSQCAQWCAQNFVHPGNKCTSDAAKGTGPCYECGPARSVEALNIQLCNEVCTNVFTDVHNCGSCGISCSADQTCQVGVCLSPPIACLCPGSDNGGYGLVANGIDGSSNLFCSYPVFPEENPYDFYCYYDPTTGVLVADVNVGLCPSTALC